MRFYMFSRCKILFECNLLIYLSRFIGCGKHGRFVSQQVAPINAHCHWDVPLSKGEGTKFEHELDRIGVRLETLQLKFFVASSSQKINLMFWVVTIWEPLGALSKVQISTFFRDTTLETDPSRECLVIWTVDGNKLFQDVFRQHIVFL